MTVRLINNLWKIIISNLDNDSLRAMCCVDKNFNKLCEPKELWKKNVLATEKESIVQLLEHAENNVENPWKMWHLTKCIPPVKEIDGPEKFAMIKKVDKIRKLDQLNVRGGLIPFYFAESYTLCALFRDSKGEYVVITKDGEETKKPPPGEEDDDDEDEIYGGEDQYTIKFYIGYFDSVNKTPIEEGYVKSGFCAYKGGFKNGYFHGKGEFHYPMGVYYSDNWEASDIKNGVMAWFKGGWYEGEFKRMELTGFGKYVGDTNYILEGFRGSEGEISGAGVVTDPSGFSFKANFSNGKICDPYEIFLQRINPSTRKCIENGWCTRQYTKKVFFPQAYYYCNTCNITSEKGLGLCASCYKNCHKDKGHNVEESPTIAYAFFCDCKIESTCFCFEEGKDYNPNFDNNVEPFTIYYDKLPVELRKTK